LELNKAGSASELDARFGQSSTIGRTMTFFNHGRRKDFFPGGGPTVDFSRGAPKVVEFHFIHSKQRKQPFFAKNLKGKCKISNLNAVGTGPPTAPFQRP